MVSRVSEHTEEIDELPIFWRSAPHSGTPTLYLHGAPSSSEDWVALHEHHGTRAWWRRWWRGKRSDDSWVEAPLYETGFLERSGGLAPDLPGFGRSGKPAYLRYTIEEYAGFIERFLDHIGIERVNLAMHDWGAVGLAFAQRHPDRIERLVIINAIPFLPGYRWHQAARIWRTPLLGELAMGSTTRPALRWGTRAANAAPLPESFIDSVLDHLDEGTRRAILRLYRSSPPDALARAGLDLGRVDAPALIVWGQRDPYIPQRFAGEYARALVNSELVELPDAGHWCWFDRPEVIDRVVEFLTSDRTPER